jgi:hypothetical protein
MTHRYQIIGLIASHCLPENEDHVVGVEGAAYKVLYRPVQANYAKAKSVLSTLTVCLSVELRFLPAVREVIKVMLTLLKTCYILSPLLVHQFMSLRYL